MNCRYYGMVQNRQRRSPFFRPRHRLAIERAGSYVLLLAFLALALFA